MIQHLLVAHDLSAEADLALARAVQLAQQTGARLSLLHVLDEAADEAEEARAHARLLAALGPQRGDPVQPWIRRGRPVEEILTQAAGLECDLLVMGRHHRQSPQGFLGTTLEQVLQRWSPPLLLAAATVAPYSRAVAALDYSGCASRALQAAWQLLPAGAELTALSIHEVPEMQQPEPAELAAQQALLDELLADLRGTLTNNGARLVANLRQGERNHCLDAAIATLEPQLLALGSHSRGEISAALLGSLTQQYLDQPPCDVLISR